MAVCPACGSSRIRNDYKPAPLWLRLIGMRALLCDYCNHQFCAFAPLAPRSNRRPRRAAQKADVFNAATVVNLHQLNCHGAEAKSETQAQPAQMINFNRAPLVTEQITPVRNDLRTQITRLQAQGARAAVEESARPTATTQATTMQTTIAQATTAQACPECGSPNVKRRHRNPVEKAVLSFTDHKAYTCRNCGASFYAKKDEEIAPPQLSPADRNLLESSAFNRERGLPERKR